MKLKEVLKSNGPLRRMVKKFKIYKEFFFDARDYSGHYLEAAEKSGHFEYRIMLLVHGLEKGMCRPDIRPFGYEKVNYLVKILKKLPECEQNSFEYSLACSALQSWYRMAIEKQWSLNGIREEALKFIRDCRQGECKAGVMILSDPTEKNRHADFETVLFSRRSVRDFDERPLAEEDINFALRCFHAAPTACNRQMCRVYYVESEDARKVLEHTLLGVGGFNCNSVNYFIITYDVSAFDFFGERNQGYVNVGLTAMNFANGLHAKGIGSCFMQWSNERKEDRQVRKALRLPESERIGLVLGAGYYKQETIIPCSVRREIKDLYRVI